MAQESERPGVTEMHVRMDCNGCVNRVKKALHSVDGVYEVQVNFSEQKLTVIGRAAPEKMLRAIKKTRKTATISSHTEPGGAPEQAPPAEPAPAAATSGDPPADATDHQPPAEAPPTETPAAAAAEEVPAAGEVKQSPEAAHAGAAAAAAATQPAEAKDVGEIQTMHEDYRHRRRAYPDQYWGDHRPHGGYFSGGGLQYEAPTYSSSTAVIHSYSRHGPATHVSEYGHLQPPPQSLRYAVVQEPYGELDYYYRSDRGSSDGSSSITSMFSDENPNACTIA